MNPEDLLLRGIQNIMSDDTIDAARLLAYQQYIAAQSSQVSARTADIRTYASIPQTTTSTISTAQLRLELLREESLVLQRILRTDRALRPAETHQLRERLSDILSQLRRAEAAHSYIGNPSREHASKTYPDPITLRILLEANGVMYGSRGLHIESSTSDYDFAFSYEEHKSLFHTLIRLNIPKSDSTSYFSSVPEAGYHTFFQYKALDLSGEEVKVDILFLHNDEDLDVIRASVQDLQSIPQYMLFDKKFRIIAYNKALQNRGWKEFRMSHNTDVRGFREHRQATVIRRPSDFAVREAPPWF